ncbi:hypothetical protein NM688_g7743 [Phlebia brevispora]|uniref:Uncharacterized protein n=1 Tax=Phlebia brevispora TaxID=194682 RepID=A0ACC1S1Q9_9APHY|nr:hypothetical protein NM688_g7743 [Phlebia brevispora]
MTKPVGAYHIDFCSGVGIYKSSVLVEYRPEQDVYTIIDAPISFPPSKKATLERVPVQRGRITFLVLYPTTLRLSQRKGKVQGHALIMRTSTVDNTHVVNTRGGDRFLCEEVITSMLHSVPGDREFCQFERRSYGASPDTTVFSMQQSVTSMPAHKPLTAYLVDFDRKAGNGFTGVKVKYASSKDTYIFDDMKYYFTGTPRLHLEKVPFGDKANLSTFLVLYPATLRADTKTDSTRGGACTHYLSKCSGS